MTTILSSPDTRELQKLSDLTPELAPRQAAPLLARLVKDSALLDAHVLPILGRDYDLSRAYVCDRLEV